MHTEDDDDGNDEEKDFVFLQQKISVFEWENYDHNSIPTFHSIRLNYPIALRKKHKLGLSNAYQPCYP